LWQESLSKPLIDTTAFSKSLKDAIGPEPFGRLEGLPEEEKESLRFEGEKEHGHSRSMEEDEQALLRKLLNSKRSTETYEAVLRVQEEGDKV
jgi:hypothetical protein